MFTALAGTKSKSNDGDDVGESGDRAVRKTGGSPDGDLSAPQRGRGPSVLQQGYSAGPLAPTQAKDYEAFKEWKERLLLLCNDFSLRYFAVTLEREISLRDCRVYVDEDDASGCADGKEGCASDLGEGNSGTASTVPRYLREEDDRIDDAHTKKKKRKKKLSTEKAPLPFVLTVQSPFYQDGTFREYRTLSFGVASMDRCKAWVRAIRASRRQTQRQRKLVHLVVAKGWMRKRGHGYVLLCRYLDPQGFDDVFAVADLFIVHVPRPLSRVII